MESDYVSSYKNSKTLILTTACFFISMYHNLSNHSLTDICSGCFKLFPSLENTVINVLVVKIFIASVVISLRDISIRELYKIR